MIKKFEVKIKNKKYLFNVNERKEKDFMMEYGPYKPTFIEMAFPDKVKSILKFREKKDKNKNLNLYDPNNPDKLFS